MYSSGLGISKTLLALLITLGCVRFHKRDLLGYGPRRWMWTATVNIEKSCHRSGSAPLGEIDELTNISGSHWSFSVSKPGVQLFLLIYIFYLNFLYLSELNFRKKDIWLHWPPFSAPSLEPHSSISLLIKTHLRLRVAGFLCTTISISLYPPIIYSNPLTWSSESRVLRPAGPTAVRRASQCAERRVRENMGRKKNKIGKSYKQPLWSRRSGWMAGSRGCWGPPCNVAAQLKRHILDDISPEGQTKDSAALHKITKAWITPIVRHWRGPHSINSTRFPFIYLFV